MKKLAFFLVMAGLSAVTAKAGQTVTGPPEVIDSTTMIVDDKTVQLDNIVSLKPGSPCVWKNRPLDCGIVATAGLKDLVAGSNVVCKQNTSGKYTCTADGYDLSYGLIHAGWAVPDRAAPAHYVKKMKQAKMRKLGFWGATNSSGEIVAVRLRAR